MKKRLGYEVPAHEKGIFEEPRILSEVGRTRAAELLRDEYSRFPDACLRDAVRVYITLRSRKGDGTDLAKRWGAQLSTTLATHPAIIAGHKDILDLLYNGLPESPVHLENFAPERPT